MRCNNQEQIILALSLIPIFIAGFVYSSAAAAANASIIGYLGGIAGIVIAAALLLGAFALSTILWSKVNEFFECASKSECASKCQQVLGSLRNALIAAKTTLGIVFAGIAATVAAMFIPYFGAAAAGTLAAGCLLSVIALIN